MKRVFLSALLCALVTTGCLRTPSGHAEAATFSSDSHSPDELAVMEAVFRHLFDHNYSGMQKNADAYSLVVVQKGYLELNPSKQFLLRFADLRKPVRDKTRFRTGKDLPFRITEIKMKETDFYQVSAGYYEGPLSSSSTLFDVRRQGKTWKVSRNPDAPELISERPNQAPQPTHLVTSARPRG